MAELTNTLGYPISRPCGVSKLGTPNDRCGELAAESWADTASLLHDAIEAAPDVTPAAVVDSSALVYEARAAALKVFPYTPVEQMRPLLIAVEKLEALRIEVGGDELPSVDKEKNGIDRGWWVVGIVGALGTALGVFVWWKLERDEPGELP